MHDFHPCAPEIKYVQGDEIAFVLSLGYDLFAANEHVSKKSILSWIL